MARLARIISPIPPPSPLDKIKLKIKAKVVEVPTRSGGIISTARQISPLQDHKSTLKVAMVEVVQMVEIFPVYLVKDAS
jgi:hypothetical protein